MRHALSQEKNSDMKKSISPPKTEECRANPDPEVWVGTKLFSGNFQLSGKITTLSNG
jgi:hypothetical protein